MSGLNRPAARRRTSKADLFLNRGHSVDVHAVVLGRLHGLDHHEHGYPVVHALARAEAAHLHEVAVHCHHVAEAHLCLRVVGREPRVDEVVLNLRPLVHLLGRQHVLRFGAEHQHAVDWPAACMNDDPLTGHVPRVPPAERLEPHEAFVVDVLDDEPDLVHMGPDPELLGFAFLGLAVARLTHWMLPMTSTLISQMSFSSWRTISRIASSCPETPWASVSRCRSFVFMNGVLPRTRQPVGGRMSTMRPSPGGRSSPISILTVLTIVPTLTNLPALTPLTILTTTAIRPVPENRDPEPTGQRPAPGGIAPGRVA